LKHNKRENDDNNSSQLWNEEDRKLNVLLRNLKKDVHTELMDCFNTPKVIASFQLFLEDVKSYVKAGSPKTALLTQSLNYLTKMFRVFGMIEDNIGFSSNEGNFEERVKPILDIFSNFRSNIRQQAIKKGDYKEILKTCDIIRDDELLHAGVKLEDIGDKSVWKIEDVDVLLKEKQFKIEEEERIKKKKEELKKEKEKKQNNKDEKAKVNPIDMFKTDEYSAWDETGIPTNLKNGDKVSESKLKKLKKLYQDQEKLYNSFILKKNE
jgi:cysteinyl-tRNA synthetase